MAEVEFGNFILAQITSKRYSSKTAIRIKSSDFVEGGLPIVSFVRPDKLFTADVSIIRNVAGVLAAKTQEAVLQRVRRLFL